jgi:hypothetical protein
MRGNAQKAAPPSIQPTLDEIFRDREKLPDEQLYMLNAAADVCAMSDIVNCWGIVSATVKPFVEPGSQLAIAGWLTVGSSLKGAMVFRRHIMGTLDGPFNILLEQDRADEADDGIFVGEDADHLGPPLGLAVEPLDRVDRVRLGAMLGREGHVGDHIGLGLVQEGGELWQLGAGWPATWRHCARAASASSWAKAVAMKEETTRRPLLPA